MATAHSHVDEMENLLTCSDCLLTLQDPRTLGCFHSFCKDCLKTFVKSEREKKAAEAPKRKTSDKDTDFEEFSCPVCMSTFRLKRGEEVEGMTPNHFICNMLEVLAIQRQEKVMSCSHCEGFSVRRCTNCNQFLCSECLRAHENWPDFKNHTVLTMAEFVLPENQRTAKEKSYCEEHRIHNKTLKFYCETCQEMACRYCIDFSHSKENHSYLLTEKVAEREREAISVLCGSLEESLKEGQMALADIANITLLLESNAKKAKEKIFQRKKSVLKTFREKLDKKASSMLDEVDEKYKATSELLAKQESKLQVFVKKVKRSLNLSKSLVQRGNDEEILSSKKMIEENVGRVKNERPKRMKPVHDGVMKLEVLQVDYESVLDNLGKVVCPPATSILNLLKTSAILKDHPECVADLEKWIDDELHWHLCYRASTDGWDASNFHACCDDKGPTVTLVKVEDNIFGGYTDQSWKGKGYKHSDVSFLFSLSNKDNVPPFKAPVKENESQTAVYCHSRLGPVFGYGYDLRICMSNEYLKSYSNLGRSYHMPEQYQYKTTTAQSLLAGSQKFSPTEIEVFY